MVVLHDFDPSSFPMSGTEQLLALKAGQQIQVLCDGTGEWLSGHVVGEPERTGRFPKNHAASTKEYKEMMRSFEASDTSPSAPSKAPSKESIGTAPPDGAALPSPPTAAAAAPPPESAEAEPTEAPVPPSLPTVVVQPPEPTEGKPAEASSSSAEPLPPPKALASPQPPSEPYAASPAQALSPSPSRPTAVSTPSAAPFGAPSVISPSAYSSGTQERKHFTSSLRLVRAEVKLSEERQRTQLAKSRQEVLAKGRESLLSRTDEVLQATRLMEQRLLQVEKEMVRAESAKRVTAEGHESMARLAKAEDELATERQRAERIQQRSEALAKGRDDTLARAEQMQKEADELQARVMRLEEVLQKGPLTPEELQAATTELDSLKQIREEAPEASCEEVLKESPPVVAPAPQVEDIIIPSPTTSEDVGPINTARRLQQEARECQDRVKKAAAELEQERQNAERLKEETRALANTRDDAVARTQKVRKEMDELEERARQMEEALQKGQRGVVPPLQLAKPVELPVELSQVVDEKAAPEAVEEPPAEKQHPAVPSRPSRPSTAEKAAPKSAPKAATEVAQVSFSMKVQNVDYSLLSSNTETLDAFKATLRQSIAEQAGKGVLPSHVHLELSAGSVVVKATVKPPPTVSVQKVQSNLKVAVAASKDSKDSKDTKESPSQSVSSARSNASAGASSAKGPKGISLAQKVLAEIRGISGIKAVSTGEIVIGKLSTPKVQVVRVEEAAPPAAEVRPSSPPEHAQPPAVESSAGKSAPEPPGTPEALPRSLAGLGVRARLSRSTSKGSLGGCRPTSAPHSETGLKPLRRPTSGGGRSEVTKEVQKHAQRPSSAASKRSTPKASTILPSLSQCQLPAVKHSPSPSRPHSGTKAGRTRRPSESTGALDAPVGDRAPKEREPVELPSIMPRSASMPSDLHQRGPKASSKRTAGAVELPSLSGCDAPAAAPQEAKEASRSRLAAWEEREAKNAEDDAKKAMVSEARAMEPPLAKAKILEPLPLAKGKHDEEKEAKRESKALRIRHAKITKHSVEDAISLAYQIQAVRELRQEAEHRIKKKSSEVREVSKLVVKIEQLRREGESKKIVFLPSFWNSWRKLAERITDADEDCKDPPPPPPLQPASMLPGPPPGAPPTPPPPEQSRDLQAAMAVKRRLLEAKERMIKLNAALRAEARQLRGDLD